MTPVLLTSQPLGSRPLRSRPGFVDAGLTRRRRDRYGDSILVGKPGRCPEVPVLCLLLYDNSGSVTGGNDPVGRRFFETRLAIERIGARCRCGKDLVAILHFDTPTSGDLKPTPTIKPHRAEIQSSLAIPPDGAGASMLGPSITAARRIADRHKATHRIVLAVLTDFQLFDDHLDDLVAFPGDVHAVSLCAEAPAKLIQAPSVTVTNVNHASPPGTVARSIFTALAETRVGARALEPAT